MSWRNPFINKCKQLLSRPWKGTNADNQAAKNLLDGQMVGAPGGLPKYWSESPNLRLASQVEPSAEEKSKLYQEMAPTAVRDPQGRVIDRDDDSSRVVPGAIRLSYVRGGSKL